MLKKILNLEGVTILDQEQQNQVVGGKVTCESPVFSHFEAPGEGAINGGQGGAVYTQNCVDTGFLGLGKPKKFIHTFSV
ncbi:hypothetical protein [Lacinutrix undariae]